MQEINKEDTLKVDDLLNVGASMLECEESYRLHGMEDIADRYKIGREFVRDILNDYFNYSYKDIDDAIMQKYADYKMIKEEEENLVLHKCYSER